MVRWIIPLKVKKDFFSTIILKFYNNLYPIFMTFMSAIYFSKGDYSFGYAFLIFAFIPLFFPLEWKEGDIIFRFL